MNRLILQITSKAAVSSCESTGRSLSRHPLLLRVPPKSAFSTTTSSELESSSSPPQSTRTSPLPPTAPGGNLLDAFRDPLSREERLKSPVGRSWHARELRRKSFDDLHKLWYVLYRERNMLLTEQQLSRRHTLVLPQPDRLKKVRKSMGAIKQVLGERKREKIAQAALRQMEQMDEGYDEDNEDDDDEDTEMEPVEEPKKETEKV